MEEIVGKIYGTEFPVREITFIIFNSQTGTLRKEIIDNYDEAEPSEHELEIMENTAENVKDEILRLAYERPCSDVQYVWNKAIIEAANCCNGYE